MFSTNTTNKILIHLEREKNNYVKASEVLFSSIENVKESLQRSLGNWLNYNNKLLSQFSKNGDFLVVYNGGSQKIRLALIENQKYYR